MSTEDATSLGYEAPPYDWPDAAQTVMSRRIEIDAAHRVPHHESKCFYIHGHRYAIIANVQGLLAASGPETGMVMDFGFLKEVMIEHIHDPCDHGLILWNKDDLILNAISWQVSEPFPGKDFTGPWMAGHSVSQKAPWKLYIMAEVPTAENLAKHWYLRMKAEVTERTNNRAFLKSVVVYETPNGSAIYPT